MRFLIASFAITLLAAFPARGQEPPLVPPAHVSYVEGDATLYHDGEWQPAVLNMAVLEGDRLRTANGRVEVMFADGSGVDIDADSDVEFLGGTRVRVLAGTIENRTASLAPSSSSQYLPSDLRPYGTDFDRYGAWENEPGYGYVWYPTVAVDWRPYYYGYWAPLPPYGWSWIGYDRWTWPTHHYGRWGHQHNRWFWIPGRSWGAAWVSWGTAPNYVSWCPLGYDGRPVVAFSIGYQSGWNPWTIVPRDRFAVRGYSVHRYAIEPQRVASTTPFLIHRSAPAMNVRRGARTASVGPAVAVPRTDRQTNTIRSADGGIYRVPTHERRGPDVTPPRDAAANASTLDRVPRANERVAAPTVGQPGAVYRAPTDSNRTGDYRVPRPGYAAPRPSPEVTSAPPARSGERPAYQPRYQPRYEPTREAPRPGPPPRASAPARQVAPARPAPAPQRQAAPAPARGSGGAAQRENGRSSQGRSEGAAARRPR